MDMIQPVSFAEYYDKYTDINAKKAQKRLLDMKADEEQAQVGRNEQIRGLFASGQRPTGEQLSAIDPNIGMQYATQQAQQEDAQSKAQQHKFVFASQIAKTVLAHAKMLEQSGIPRQDALNQAGGPYRAQMAAVFGHQDDPNKPIDGNGLMSLSQYGQVEKPVTYTPVSTPGGQTQWYNAKDPMAGPLGGQQQPAQEQPQLPTTQPVSYSGDGMTNIFAPQQAQLSPKSQQLQEEQNIRSTADQQKLEREAKQKQIQEAVALLQGDPEKRAAMLTATNNLADYHKNLEEYGKGVKGNPLMDNATAYKARATLGADTNISNLENAGWGFVQDQIKAMKSAGLSPTQMMNTELEAERFKKAITGSGTAASMKESFNKFLRAQKQDLIAHEERRKKASELVGGKYQPLVDVNTMPGSKIMSMPTGDKPIGKTGVVNGQRIRVIGPDQVEVIE